MRVLGSLILTGIVVLILALTAAYRAEKESKELHPFWWGSA